MNNLNKIKYLSFGCLTGASVQLYLFSRVDTRLQMRKNEINSLMNVYSGKKETPTIKKTYLQRIKKEQDLIFPFLLSIYTEYIISLAFLLYKVTLSDDLMLVNKIKKEKEKIGDLYQNNPNAMINKNDK